MVAFFEKITDVLNNSNIPYMLSGSVAMSMIISKLIWIQDIQSSQQMEDIKNLTAIENLDWPYINGWIKKLNLKSFDLFQI